VLFALALVCDPELLVLDEPTVGMEVESRRAFWVSMRAFAAGGKTVMFATHYLEEADAYADRAVLMAHGRIVADGPTSEIRARVGRRTIRATLADADLERLTRFPGVAAVDRRGDLVLLSCSDSDATVRALLDAHPEARDIEITGAGLEDAFLQLTGGGRRRDRRAGRDGRMTALAYTRFELVRTLRNVRLLLFSLGFPLALFFVIAAPNRHEHDFAGSGISVPLYYMVGLVGFGTMTGLIATGARIASERTDGWTRQLRVTPLSPRAYLRAKVLTGYAMALLTIALLHTSGAVLGVSLPAERWLEMTGLSLVGLLPFAALGVLVGHLLTADTIGPANAGLVSVLAFVSGTWFPLGDGFLHDVAQFLPSYWLVQASHVALGGSAWTTTGGPWSLPGRSCSLSARAPRTAATPNACDRNN
jgi:ABC-2 type transport system permease protein